MYKATRICTVLLAFAIALAGCASTAPNVPLPPDLRIAAQDPTLAPHVRGLAGKWTGYWARPDGRLNHVLVVEEINGSTAKVVYAYGALITSQGGGIDPGWFRTTGNIDANGQLSLNLRAGQQAVYRLQSDGSLKGSYKHPQYAAPLQGALTRSGT